MHWATPTPPDYGVPFASHEASGMAMGLSRVICAFAAAWRAWSGLRRDAASAMGAARALRMQAARS
jgi:hypothetical protein